MNSNNVIQLKSVEKQEPIIDSDYFGTERSTTTNFLSLIELIKQSKEKNGNS